MSTFDYDPQTGLPKPGSQKLNTPVPNRGVPVFHTSTVVPGTAGATGVGAFTTQNTPPGGNQPANPYLDIIRNDPLYNQTLADLAAQGFADEASAKAAAQSGFVRFGEVPGDLDPAHSGWIDQTTRDLAAQNTAAGTSTLARLQKANKDQLRMMKNALAARGALQSGELRHQLGEENTRFSNANYDARLQLTDYLSGIQRGLAEAARRRQEAAAAAAAAAAGRGIAGGQGGGGGGGGGGGQGGGTQTGGSAYDQYMRDLAAMPPPAQTPGGGLVFGNPDAAAWASVARYGGDNIDPDTGLPRRR